MRKTKEALIAGRVFKRRRRDPKDPSQWIESPNFWIQYYHHRQIRKPTTTQDYQEAVRALNKELRLAAAGKVLPLEAERMKFSDLTQLITRDYRRNERRSLSRAERAIVHLTGFFGFTRPAEIDFNMIDQYVDFRKDGNKAANATIKYELAMLKKGFSLAKNILQRTPEFPVINTANIRKGFFEEAEFKVFLSKFDADLQPALQFAYLTGWRMKSEIFTMQWTQVDFQAGTIRLEPGTTKNKDGRIFPFKVLPELESLMRAQRERTDTLRKEHYKIIPWVFHRNGRQIADIRGAWKQALEACPEITPKIPHDFRRTAVRNFERAGIPRAVAMKLVGHKTEEIYRRYAIVASQDLEDGLQRLANYRLSLQDEKPKVVPIKKEEANG